MKKGVRKTGRLFHHKKIARSKDRAALSLLLQSAGNLTGTQATGAGVDITGRPVHYRFHSSHVGLPSSVRTTVGVGHLDAKRHALAAASTFCHCTAPPLFKSLEYNIK